MSRIGNRVLTVPAGVTVEVVENNVKVKGPKGELELVINPAITVEVTEGKLETKRVNETKEAHTPAGKSDG